MMYRIAVCDDNPADRAYVAALIERWGRAAGMGVTVERYPSAESFLFAYEEDPSFDVLCLDIEMGEISGVELAKKLRRLGAGLQIVFVTGYMEYIADGYDVEALHYLLKPVTEEKLGSVLARALERVKAREKELFLQTTDGSVRVLNSEIRYLEVQRNYVTIHAAEEYTVKRTLGDLEKELDESFFRTGRSFIVNLRFVRKITKTQVFLKDGAQVPLSRGLYEGINRAMIQYF